MLQGTRVHILPGLVAFSFSGFRPLSVKPIMLRGYIYPTSTEMASVGLPFLATFKTLNKPEAEDIWPTVDSMSLDALPSLLFMISHTVVEALLISFSLRTYAAKWIKILSFIFHYVEMEDTTQPFPCHAVFAYAACTIQTINTSLLTHFENDIHRTKKVKFSRQLFQRKQFIPSVRIAVLQCNQPRIRLLDTRTRWLDDYDQYLFNLNRTHLIHVCVQTHRWWKVDSGLCKLLGKHAGTWRTRRSSGRIEFLNCCQFHNLPNRQCVQSSIGSPSLYIGSIRKEASQMRPPVSRQKAIAKRQRHILGTGVAHASHVSDAGAW